MSKRLTKIIADVNNTLLPKVCFGCNAQLYKGESVLCAICRHELPLTHYNFIDENDVDRIFYGRVPIKKAASFSFFAKDGVVKALLHHLKYKNQEHIGSFFGDWYGSLLKEEEGLGQVDAVIPVPLHPKKKKKRGYNQVALFANRVAEHLQVAYDDRLLMKIQNTKTQTKKDRQLRWENSKHVFQLNPYVKNRYKHVLLLDDVITTGATVEACAKELFRLKNMEVSVASMAVVPKG